MIRCLCGLTPSFSTGASRNSTLIPPNLVHADTLSSVTNHSGSTLSDGAIGRLTDFKRRPLWPVIPALRRRLQAGEALATPLYISLGFFATVTGALIGGVVTARFGPTFIRPHGSRIGTAWAGHRFSARHLTFPARRLANRNQRNLNLYAGPLTLQTLGRRRFISTER